MGRQRQVQCNWIGETSEAGNGVKASLEDSECRATAQVAGHEDRSAEHQADRKPNIKSSRNVRESRIESQPPSARL